MAATKTTAFFSENLVLSSQRVGQIFSPSVKQCYFKLKPKLKSKQVENKLRLIHFS